MPSATLYHTLEHKPALKNCLPELRAFIAIALSATERALPPEEISLRLVEVHDSLMIAPVEMEITAYHYPVRVKNQDNICRAVSKFLAENNLPDNHVWLLLCELGHSWEG